MKKIIIILGIISILYVHYSYHEAHCIICETGKMPWMVTTGDFNRDGLPDIATANKMSDDVSVFINQGDETFSWKRDYATDEEPIALAVEDYNQDGYPDIAVAACGVSILMNNHDGTFASKITYNQDDLADCHYGIASADLNLDGYPDLVLTHRQNYISVLMNVEKGAFLSNARRYYDTQVTDFVVTGDLNLDGYPDIILTDIGSYDSESGISIFFNNKTGLFLTERYYPAETPESITLNDFNQDGYPDIAIGNFRSIYIFWNNEGKDFTKVPLPLLQSRIEPICSADYNQDEYPDIIIAVGGYNVLLNNRDGAFKNDYYLFPTRFDPISPGGLSITMADLNQDNYPDKIITEPAFNHLTITFNPGNLPPIADITPDDLIAEKEETINLDGSESSDYDGWLISYQWEQTDGPSVTLSDTNSPTISFTMPEGSVRLKLTVEDNKYTRTSEEVLIKLAEKGKNDDKGGCFLRTIGR